MSVALQANRTLEADAFRSLFEQAPSPLALAAPATPTPTLVAANDAFLHLLGLPRTSVEGQPLNAVFRAAAATQIRHAVENCLTAGEAVRLRIAHAQAARVTRLEVEVRPIEVGSDLLAIVGLTSLDRRLSLAELGEAGVLAELGALSRGLVYIQDVARDRVRYGRHPLVDRIGLPPGPLSLAHIRALVHPQDRGAFEAHLADEAVAPDDRVTVMTFRMRAADGTWLWISVRSRVFTRDRRGAVHRVIGVATDVTDDHLHASAMAAAAVALSRAEVNERRRIGRELHDSTSQLLVAAKLGLGAIERQQQLDLEVKRTLDEVRDTIAVIQAEIRNFSYTLHPPGLEEQGLARCLRAFTAGFSTRTGLAISVRVGRGLGRLSPGLEQALYRITQEALMNVYRHAGASRAWVRLTRLDGRITLEVEDNGVGLSAPSRLGVGVSGMRARMTQLGGTLSLQVEHRGMLVRATAPVATAADG